MTELLGKPVADNINEQLRVKINELKNNGIIPTLAVVRVGAREDDLSYERGLLKKFDSMECKVNVFELPVDCTQQDLEELIVSLNENASIHGILMFRPLPRHLSEERIKTIINPAKDIDSMGTASLATVFAGAGEGYPPCTAQAVIEILKYYDIPLKGKKVTVIGRSLVIGKPVAMMLIKENATVTVCHTKTVDTPSECRNADIIVAAAGVAKMVKADYVKAGQTVIDVGMNVDENGKLCGDVDFDEVSSIVDKITPVPRGVGSVTTSVLLKHVVESAEKSANACKIL
ncbi:MAG: bifunctional 5,10-methylenetetrahydrofolate dehydrogenase/5,10-methenyltetrahydrofolate cyclohydrolase [Clostridia bacterium]|nr:bifunctional 5,10-methylenetetrahydrofolate dehydrogenase/5,10-methenyltetrahydrofolate cyclohydrolase [Clostridia bacterium]